MDGKGHNLVYYFQLSQNFSPSTSDVYAKALKQIQNLISEATSPDKLIHHQFRNKMKLVPRIVNHEEFGASWKLSRYQQSLLGQYRDKPMMTRPNHRFFVDPSRNYWEYDMDIHNYSYILRQVTH